MINILIKNEHGQYAFSDSGIFHAYFLTMQKLMIHYMVKGMKLQGDILTQKKAGLKNYIEENFSILDDFLDKLPQLAQYLGETNLARFTGFIGKNFITSLEAVKTQLYDKELPKAKDRFENPYRVTSSEMLDQYEDLFTKAKTLIWPPENLTKTESSHDSTTQVNLTPAPTAIASDRILEKYAEIFAKSPELKWPPQSNQVSNETNENDNITSNLPEMSNIVPGERMLEKFQKIFASCPFLDLESSTSNNTSTKGNLPTKDTLPVQITLREFTQISNQIKKFAVAKDNAGYQKWLGSLKDLHKASVIINKLANHHIKTGQVNWQQEFSKLSPKVTLVPNILEKIKTDILGYKKILPKLQQHLQKLKKDGLEPNLVSSLYSQLINLFENSGIYESKKTSLKMTMLQISNQDLKKEANELFGKLLDNAKDIYHLT